MNLIRIKSSWKQLKGSVKQQWRKLTNYLMACKICESHGISKSQMAVWREHQEGIDHPK